MAGVSRLQYTSEMRLMRVMCSGRVDMLHVLRAIARGMDGVFIGGCHFNECNYITHGNFHTLNMVLLTKKLLAHVGVHPDRLRMRVMSGAEGALYAEHVNSFVSRVYELGALGSAEGEKSPEEIQAGVAMLIKEIPYIKLMTNEKLGKKQEITNDDVEYFTAEEVSDLLNKKISYYIEPEKCQACMTCTRRCPVGAIASAKATVHVIDQDKCIRCGACIAGCPPRFEAIKKFDAGVAPPPPLPEDQRAIVKKAKDA